MFWSTAVFCPNPIKLPAAKLKCNGLIYLVEEISTRQNDEPIMWWPGITFVLVLNAKRASRSEKQNMQFKEKKNSKKLNASATAWDRRER